MKKTVALLLTLTLMLGGAICARADEALPPAALVIGALDTESQTEAVHDHNEALHGLDGEEGRPSTLLFANLSTLLLALENGQIHLAGLSEPVARYIQEGSDHLVCTRFSTMSDSDKVHYSMMVREDSKELFDKLDKAIGELKEEGIIDQLKEEQMEACIESDPLPGQLPHIEGAPTVRVAVTGDLPPMDYVTADGAPAGFNVSLLSAISLKAGLNFELVVEEAGARLTALSAGKVDALFWTDSLYCQEHGFAAAREVSGALITQDYMQTGIALLMKLH